MFQRDCTSVHYSDNWSTVWMNQLNHSHNPKLWFKSEKNHVHCMKTQQLILLETLFISGDNKFKIRINKQLTILCLKSKLHNLNYQMIHHLNKEAYMWQNNESFERIKALRLTALKKSVSLHQMYQRHFILINIRWKYRYEQMKHLIHETILTDWFITVIQNLNTYL